MTLAIFDAQKEPNQEEMVNFSCGSTFPWLLA